MDLDGDDLAAFPIAAIVLFAAHHALDHRVDPLQVARVGPQRGMDAPAGGSSTVCREAAVVLHVARALRVEGHQRGLELREEGAIGHTLCVGHHVQAPAVRHRDDQVVRPQLGRA